MQKTVGNRGSKLEETSRLRTLHNVVPYYWELQKITFNSNEIDVSFH